MKLIRFFNDGDGDLDPTLFHLDGVGSDHTLCGETLDGDDKTAGQFEMVNAKAVTCPACIAIICHCRGVKIATRTP